MYSTDLYTTRCVVGCTICPCGLRETEETIKTYSTRGWAEGPEVNVSAYLCRYEDGSHQRDSLETIS